MAEITQEQVVEAAQKLGKEEFNRQDIADALGVEKSDVKQAFTKARKEGQFEKVRDDEENTGIFKLGASVAGGAGGAATLWATGEVMLTA
jgi:DNA-binding transcriptional regulator LsrR (DeoR family)